MVIEASRVATGTVHITAMTVISYLASFFFYIGIARILTPDDVGLVSLMLSMVAILNTVTLLAMNSAVIKFLSEFLAKGDIASSSAVSRKVFRLVTVISVLAFFALGLLSSLILAWTFQGQIAMHVFLLFLGVSLILNYTTYYGAVMAGLAMFGAVALQNIIFSAASRLSSLALAFLGLGMNGVTIGYFLAASACLIYSVLAVRGRLQHSKSESSFPLKEILSFSLPVYAFNIITLAQGWMDTILVYSLTSALAVTGTYYIVVASSGILSILWSPLVFTLLPTLSSRYGSNGMESIEHALARTIRLIVLPVLLVGAGLAAVSPTALTILYGQKYADGALPFAILALLSVFSAFSNLLVTVLQAIKRTGKIAVAGAVSVVANVTVLILLVGPLGILGAALGRAAMTIAMSAATYLALRSSVRVPWNNMSTIKGIFAALIVGAPLFLLDSAMRNVGLPLLEVAILDVMLFFIVALSCLRLLKLFDQEDIELLKSILPRPLKWLTSIIA